MSILRLASQGTKRLDLGDGDFLEVREDLTKKVFNSLMSFMPDREVNEEKGISPQEGAVFARGLFETLVVGWSLPDDPTVENYDALSSEAANVVDAALVEHFASLAPNKEEMSKVTTSQGSRRKASTRTT